MHDCCSTVSPPKVQGVCMIAVSPPPKVLQGYIHTLVFEECCQHDIRYPTHLNLRRGDVLLSPNIIK